MQDQEHKEKRYYVCPGMRKKYAVLDRLQDRRVDEFDDPDVAIKVSNRLNEWNQVQKIPLIIADDNAGAGLYTKEDFQDQINMNDEYKAEQFVPVGKARQCEALTELLSLPDNR